MFDARLVDTLEKARVDANSPLHINSGYRCPKHNAEVGGSEQSRHMEGLAIDVGVGKTGLTVRELADMLVRHGAKRAILYLTRDFVHVEPCDRYNYDGTMKTREILVP